jgi:hypothetical protein
VLYGASHGIQGRAEVNVSTTAVQLADGSIDDGSRLDPPFVYVEANDLGLTSQQARELAAVLIGAADEVDGWAQRPTP